MSPSQLKSGLSVVLMAVAAYLGPLAPVVEAATVPSAQHPTIQAAINDLAGVPNGSTIEVQPGVYPEALLVGAGRVLTIRGVGGAGSTIVDASGKGAAAINVFRAGTVVIQGLTFRNGAVTAVSGGGFVVEQSSPSFIDCVFESNSALNGGGGALITSNATFTNCVFRNNRAARFGGGIYLASGSRPTFTRCDFVNNASGTGGAGVGNNGAGGGVFSLDSSPTFRSSRINANTSKFAAGGLFHMGVFGSSYGRSTLVIEDTEVNDNVSTQFSPQENPAEGGGLHVEDNASAVMTRVRVLRNRGGTGGGLAVYRAQVDLVDSVIASNQALNGFGGGIAATSNNLNGPVYPASVINLTQTLVRGNTATTAGGGIAVVGDNFCGGGSSCVGLKATLSVVGSVIDNNRSPAQGGGILLDRASLTIRDSIVLRNRVTMASTAFGGGLAISTASSASITGTTFSSNAADLYGGAIFMNDGATIQMSGSQLYANTAPEYGGGAVFVGPTGLSGTIQNSIMADNSGYQIVEHRCPAPVAIALSYRGNSISGGTGVYYGGCVLLGSVSAFNNHSGSDGTSTNNANLPSFAKFLAAPRAGVPATLAWSVARAATTTIDGVGSFNQESGTVDVAPVSSTHYSLTASVAGGGSVGPIGATVLVDDVAEQVKAPTGLYVASVVRNTVTLGWTRGAGGLAPTSYLIEGGVNPGEVLASLPTGSTAPTHTFSLPTGAFYLRVHAVAGAARSAASNEIRVAVNVPSPPAAPENLLGLVNGSSLALAWKNSLAGGAPTGLLLDVSGPIATTVPIGLTDTFRFSAVPPGTYTLSLRATGAAGVSPSSNPVTLTFPGACSGAPLAVSNLVTYRAGNTMVATWDPPPAGPANTSYVVSVTGSFTGTFPVSSRTVSGAVGPGTYQLSVAATNPCGTGPFTPGQAVLVP